MKINVTDREHATILAALRHWQAEHSGTELPAVNDGIYDIATDGDQHTMLNVDEIDDLCERINTES